MWVGIYSNRRMKTFWSVVTVLALLVLTFLGGRYTKQCPAPEIRIDTLIQCDTMRIVEPHYIDRYVVRTDSIPYYIHTSDTVVKYVHIPIERREYRDSTYFAIVEGYNPSLYYIETYNKTTFIDRVETHTIKTKPRWGFGVQVGYGYNFNTKFTPYVGVGVQYNILTW